jgi:hypothetical protein
MRWSVQKRWGRAKGEKWDMSTDLTSELQMKAQARSPLIVYKALLYSVGVGSSVPAGTMSIRCAGWEGEEKKGLEKLHVIQGTPFSSSSDDTY